MDSNVTQFMTVADRAKEKLRRDLGVLILDALNDPKTVEIMLNPDGKVWHEKLGGEMMCIGTMSKGRAESVIKTVSGFHGKEITCLNPRLECELPLDGSRFTAQIQPVVLAPTFTIRKKAVSIFTLDEYVENKIMTESQSLVIKEAIANHRNVIVIGGTGTGKTTLINGMINQIVLNNPSERLIIIEDTGEIQCNAENHVQYHTTAEVDLTALIKTSLRMRPDRILIGEVRDHCALDLLDAWNTGHEGGVATLHANDCLSGLTRLKSLVSRNPYAPNIIEPLIAEAVHVVVLIKAEKGRRWVDDVMSVEGFENGKYQFKKFN